MRFGTERAILRLGGPILIGQIGIIITSFADTVMVGRYTTDALASSSFVNNVFMAAMTAVMGFSYGLTPIVGALFPQKRFNDIGGSVKASVVLTLLFALLVGGVMLALYFNLENLGQPPELLSTIRPYYLLFLVGLFPVALFNVFAQWSYAINRTMAPTWALLVCNAFNILGNYGLIYGELGMPEMGLTGAGISTLVARIIAACFMLWVFFGQGRFADYRRGFTITRLSTKMLGKVFKTSWPVSAQMALESGSFSVAAIMAGWLGAISLAAYQVILVTGMLGFMIYVSFASAVAIIVSNRAGLGDREGQREAAWAGWRIELFITTLISIALFLGAKYIVAMFTDDAAVLAMTLTLVVPLVLYQYADCTQINFCNALRGTSNVMPMMWTAGIAYIIIGIPACYFIGIASGLGVYGIVLSFSVSLVAAAALYFYYFLHTTRKKGLK